MKATMIAGMYPTNSAMAIMELDPNAIVKSCLAADGFSLG